MRGLALTVGSGTCSESYRSVTRAGAACGWANELPTLPPRGGEEIYVAAQGNGSDFDLRWIEGGINMARIPRPPNEAPREPPPGPTPTPLPPMPPPREPPPGPLPA
jgi:hypothetical protein